MTTAATFLPVGGLGENLTLGDIKQVGAFPGAYILTTYGNNVNIQKEYIYFDDEVASTIPVEPGWYEVDGDGNPYFDKGAQNSESLPYGQGCVISSFDGEGLASFTSAGEVTDKNEEFAIPLGDRKMTGNILPRTVNIGEIKQVGGFPGAYILATYGNNVNIQNEYIYFDEEVASTIPVEAGWYEVDGDGNPDFEKGCANFNLNPSEGFVVTSFDGEGLATLRYPKAIAE